MASNPTWERIPVGRGLDLTSYDTVTDEEQAAFHRNFLTTSGRVHPGLQLLLDARPDALKRYRTWADRLSLPGPGARRAGFGLIARYAVWGYTAGVRYLVHGQQLRGLTRDQVMEGIAAAFIFMGPRGLETVADGLAGFEWTDPKTTPDWGSWDVDPDAFRSGLDFSRLDMLPGELDLLVGWYERVEGEVPPYVRSLGRHRPELLKGYRNRFENTLRLLPKQQLPYLMIHVAAERGSRPGIREGMLLARATGMSRDEAYEAVMWGSFYGGMDAISTAEEAAGDVLEAWR